MKVFGVGNNGQPEIIDLPQGNTDTDKLSIIVKRISHSAHDWQWARAQDKRYEINGNNSFQNLLTAMYDLAMYLQVNATTKHDKVEFANLIKQLSS